MILNFKTKIDGKETGFKEKILSGQKIHTIRKKGRWKPGDIIHFSTGARSKNYECFKMGTVVSVQEIYLHNENNWIEIDGKLLDSAIHSQIISNDGFDYYGEFWNWFKKPGDFELIHWTNKLY